MDESLAAGIVETLDRLTEASILDQFA
jgi:hypothetical protein